MDSTANTAGITNTTETATGPRQRMAAAGRATGQDQPRAQMHFIGRRATAVALVAGAVLNAGAALVNTAFLQGANTAAGYAEALAGRVPLGMAGLAMNIVGIVLMLAGLLGLLQRASTRAPLVSRIAAWSTTLGMVAFLCMNGALVALYGFGASGETERALAAEQLTGASPAMVAMLLPFLLGNAVGMVCTSIALLKSRTTPLWVPVALLVFFVADFMLPAIPWFDAHLIFTAFAAGAAWAVLRHYGHAGHKGEGRGPSRSSGRGGRA